MASLLMLFSAVSGRDWLGFAGVALTGFIAFAFAVDFDRTGRDASLTAKRRRMLLLSVCFAALVIAAGGHLLGSLGVDIHWRNTH
jgi:hypothetical protein